MVLYIDYSNLSSLKDNLEYSIAQQTIIVDLNNMQLRSSFSEAL
jgi:hypothetical protein